MWTERAQIKADMLCSLGATDAAAADTPLHYHLVLAYCRRYPSTRITKRKTKFISRSAIEKERIQRTEPLKGV